MAWSHQSEFVYFYISKFSALKMPNILFATNLCYFEVYEPVHFAKLIF